MRFFSRKKRSPRLHTGVVAVLLLGLLVAGGVVVYNVKVQVDKEIYGTPRGEVKRETPAKYGLTYDVVTYKTDSDKEIAGWFIPNAQSKNCIILAPGKGSTKWNVLKYAPFLYGGGYNVFLFDARGRGESEGERWGFSYFESRDILHGIDYVKEEYGMERFGLLGRSAGATASLLAAADEEDIEAVVADSGFASIKMAAMSYGDYQEDPLFQIVFPLYAFVARISLGVDVNGKTKVMDHVNEGDFAAFFIHGRDDEVILPENSRVMYGAKKRRKRIWAPEGVEHVQTFDVHPKEYRTKVLDFFREHLRPSGTA
ncbi:MAG: alpha/beta hydrolase [Candidatus Acetothermia bacterium]